jgi:hypothetical protein
MKKEEEWPEAGERERRLPDGFGGGRLKSLFSGCSRARRVLSTG